jgi:RNA polymerase sigma factor (sigma-70 family)
MPSARTSRLLDHFRRATLLRDGAGLTDAQLLTHFIAEQDGDAFAALVRRHGPMVLGVCRRVLGNPHDAEDAFQATFLILARKAASIVARDAPGGWLYRVAYRTALAARARIARRRTAEQQVDAMPHAEAGPEDDWRELVPLLDRELDRLPDKYRVPVVLCELEGRSRKEVARRLRIPEGTLSSRLAYARKLLARRLARQGAVLPAGALAAALSREAASACVPPALLKATAEAGLRIAAGQALAAGVVSASVAALTQGVLKAMLLSKLNVVWGVALALVVGAGAVTLTYRQAAAQSPAKREASQVGRAGTDELEELRLEVAALRKGLEATRERVKTLEGTLQGLTAQGLNPTWARPSVASAPLDNANPPGHSQATIALDFGFPATRAPKSQPPTDLLTAAEAALKQLREHPGDRQATEALEQAVKRLKEQSKPAGGTGLNWQAK